jgi:hypothetical protein
MHAGDGVLAAKCFFRTGYDASEDELISKEDNLEHLKDELFRQVIAHRPVKRFLKLAVEKNISVYGKLLCFTQDS